MSLSSDNELTTSSSTTQKGVHMFLGLLGYIDALQEGQCHYAIWGALQLKLCNLCLKNVFDKIEQYYMFRPDDPTALASSN